MQSAIQKKSYGSVTVFWLNRERVIEQIKQASQHLLKHEPAVRKVVIFGSVAEDRATAFSDVDILIVVTETELRFFERSEHYRKYFENVDIENDLFVYTEEEVEQTPLAKKAVSESDFQFKR